MGSMYFSFTPMPVSVDIYKSRENKSGAHHSHPSDTFAKHQCRSEHCEDRIQIDKIRCPYDTNLLQAPVPTEEAEHRGNASERKEISPHNSIPCKQNLPRYSIYCKQRQNGLKSVAKHLSSDKHCRVTRLQPFYNERIERPTYTSCKGQYIAKWR